MTTSLVAAIATIRARGMPCWSPPSPSLLPSYDHFGEYWRGARCAGGGSRCGALCLRNRQGLGFRDLAAIVDALSPPPPPGALRQLRYSARGIDHGHSARPPPRARRGFG